MSSDCWKNWVIMGAICSAVSLRTLAESSSGPVALFKFRFFNSLIYAKFQKGYVGIKRRGLFSWVNTELNWLLKYLRWLLYACLALRSFSRSF